MHVFFVGSLAGLQSSQRIIFLEQIDDGCSWSLVINIHVRRGVAKILPHLFEAINLYSTEAYLIFAEFIFF